MKPIIAQKKYRKTISQWLIGSLTALAVVFFILFIFRYWADIPSIDWGLPSALTLTASIILSGITININGIIWWIFLLDAYKNTPLSQSIRTIAISQFGKYLPGNIAQHFARIYMAHQQKIPSSFALSVVLIEALWSAGIAGCIGIFGIFIYAPFFRDKPSIPSISITPLVILLISTAFTFIPFLVTKSINSIFPHLARKLNHGNPLYEPTLKASFFISLFIISNVLINGFTVYLQAVYFFDMRDASLPLLTTGFALAWVVGYIVPGAPGGIGVREALFTILLGPSLGTGPALGLALTSRLTAALGDLIMYGLAHLIPKNNNYFQVEE
ncbi:MAG: lysylphosphatidylglycerol synthase domain-containing protein [Comamonas sp.]